MNVQTTILVKTISAGWNAEEPRERVSKSAHTGLIFYNKFATCYNVYVYCHMTLMCDL